MGGRGRGGQNQTGEDEKEIKVEVAGVERAAGCPRTAVGRLAFGAFDPFDPFGSGSAPSREAAGRTRRSAVGRGRRGRGGLLRKRRDTVINSNTSTITSVGINTTVGISISVGIINT